MHSQVALLNVLHLKPSFLAKCLCHFACKCVFGIPLKVLAACADVHGLFATRQHDISAAQVLKETQLPVADQ
jgi:hypothetical protein